MATDLIKNTAKQNRLNLNDSNFIFGFINLGLSISSLYGHNGKILYYLKSLSGNSKSKYSANTNLNDTANNIFIEYCPYTNACKS